METINEWTDTPSILYYVLCKPRKDVIKITLSTVYHIYRVSLVTEKYRSKLFHVGSFPEKFSLFRARSQLKEKRRKETRVPPKE
jgi:hypothetical protein